ncbi:MAG: NAD-dependent protein deacylase [Clostridia bacterium]|nr:NAD-dependent protein deacylase [Clostridia bacterium]
MDDIEYLSELFEKSHSVVFFGGAGVSTGSGIPDFRGTDGLYNALSEEIVPEELLSGERILESPREFYDYYRKNMLYPDAEPNTAHLVLAKMEKEGKLRAVITQNIDGLHQRAGSENVIELHGSVLENYCIECGERYGLDYILEDEGVPLCEECGGLVRPDVIMYGESLKAEPFYAAEEALATADLLIVGGTSLSVYPAASLVRDFEGTIVIINKEPTALDHIADLVIYDDLGAVLSEIWD